MLQELNTKNFRCKTSNLSTGLNLLWRMLHRGCGFSTMKDTPVKGERC